MASSADVERYSCDDAMREATTMIEAGIATPIRSRSSPR